MKDDWLETNWGDFDKIEPETFKSVHIRYGDMFMTDSGEHALLDASPEGTQTNN